MDGTWNLTSLYISSLDNLSLERLDVTLFSSLTSLQELNVSDNKIREVPSELRLPHLKELDVRNNKLTSLAFVTQFPSLTDIYIEGNPIHVSEML